MTLNRIFTVCRGRKLSALLVEGKRYERSHSTPQKAYCLAQLELEIRAVRKQAQAQRKRIAQKCGYEFLALVDSDRNCKVVVIDIVQKLVFQDKEGNTVSETDSSLVGKIIQVRFRLVP